MPFTGSFDVPIIRLSSICNFFQIHTGFNPKIPDTNKPILFRYSQIPAYNTSSVQPISSPSPLSELSPPELPLSELPLSELPPPELPLAELAPHEETQITLPTKQEDKNAVETVS